jgi:hypothetical protein
MPMGAKRKGGGMAPIHSQPNTRRRWVVSSMFQLLFLPRKSWYPLYRRPVGPRDWTAQHGKSLLHWDLIPGPSSP